MVDDDGLLTHDDTAVARYRCGLPVAMTMLAATGVGLTVMAAASLGAVIVAARSWMRDFR